MMAGETAIIGQSIMTIQYVHTLDVIIDGTIIPAKSIVMDVTSYEVLPKISGRICDCQIEPFGVCYCDEVKLPEICNCLLDPLGPCENCSKAIDTDPDTE